MCVTPSKDTSGLVNIFIYFRYFMPEKNECEEIARTLEQITLGQIAKIKQNH